jgi:trehalose 6-phosphate synthase/phosphatase
VKPGRENADALPFKNLTVVSNRLPIRVSRSRSEVRIEAGSGGLVTAMTPVLQRTGGVWVGWDGDPKGETPVEEIKKYAKEVGYALRPIPLGRDLVSDYYWGFSNETLWPLFHDLLDRARFSRRYWQAYCEANQKFAVAASKGSRADSLIWIHDYHLVMASKYLRQARTRAMLAFFLHIPFPGPDLFLRLPWRDEFIDALLLYDVIGFQTERDRRNFVQCVRTVYPESRIRGSRRMCMVERRGETTVAGAFPISIDYEAFHQLSLSQEVSRRAERIRSRARAQKFILGVDRLDYTKGIPYRLKAFELALEKHPELRTRITLIQLVVPSRATVPEYARMKREIDEMVGRINGKYTASGWTPIHYIYRSLPRSELVSLYRACDIALLTPLKDGMNLVAKEYCASCTNGESGVMILSEFAGAAAQMGKYALLVNPYHAEHVADEIYRACSMEKAERRYRMRRLQAEVRRNDIFRWSRQFLGAVAEAQSR